jgi:hypothetical protein
VIAQARSSRRNPGASSRASEPGIIPTFGTNMLWCGLDQVVDGQVAILSCALEPHVPILASGYPSRARRYPEAFQD